MARITCVQHRDREASERCPTCHRPFCSVCTFVLDGRGFCGEVCATRWKQFYANPPKVPRSNALLAKVTGALFFIGCAAAVYHFGFAPIYGWIKAILAGF